MDDISGWTVLGVLVFTVILFWLVGIASVGFWKSTIVYASLTAMIIGLYNVGILFDLAAGAHPPLAKTLVVTIPMMLLLIHTISRLLRRKL